MSGVKAVAWADNLDGVAAQITVREGDFYVSYYYISDAFMPGTEIEIGYDSWATSAGEAATLNADKLALGDSFWFKAPASALADGASAMALTPAGAVYGESTLGLDIVGGDTWQMIGNPFPTTLNASSINMNGYTAVPWDDNLDGVANQITVRNGDFYVSYYYISDAFRPGTEIEIGYDTWATSAGEAVTAIATPQEGMWMRFPGNSGSVIFSK